MQFSWELKQVRYKGRGYSESGCRLNSLRLEREKRNPLGSAGSTGGSCWPRDAVEPWHGPPLAASASPLPRHPGLSQALATTDSSSSF